MLTKQCFIIFPAILSLTLVATVVLEERCINERDVLVLESGAQSKLFSRVENDPTISTALYDRSSNSNIEGGFTRVYEGDLLHQEMAASEIEMHDKLAESFPQIAPRFFSCVLQFTENRVGKVLLNFESFYDAGGSVFAAYRKRSTLVQRIRMYAGLSKAIQLLHERRIVHCALGPASIGSTSTSFEIIQLRDFSHAIAQGRKASQACRRGIATFQSKDLASLSCLASDNAFKADIWDLGVFILQNEAGGEKRFQSFVEGQKELLSEACFTSFWSSTCEDNWAKLLDTIFSFIKPGTVAEANMLISLKPIVKSMFKDCVHRPNAIIVMENFNQLLYPRIASPAGVTIKPQPPADNRWWMLKFFGSCFTKSDSPTLHMLI